MENTPYATKLEWIDNKWVPIGKLGEYPNIIYKELPMPPGYDIDTIPIPKFSIGEHISFKWFGERLCGETKKIEYFLLDKITSYNIEVIGLNGLLSDRRITYSIPDTERYNIRGIV